MPTPWHCPQCDRAFNRANTRHTCGSGDREAMLRGKNPLVVALYERLESAAHALGRIEIVAGDRYALFRTTRIFADAVLMKDALRLALQLDRAFGDALFFKTVHDAPGRVQQVAKLHDDAELDAVLPRFEHAWRLSVAP